MIIEQTFRNWRARNIRFKGRKERPRGRQSSKKKNRFIVIIIVVILRKTGETRMSLRFYIYIYIPICPVCRPDSKMVCAFCGTVNGFLRRRAVNTVTGPWSVNKPALISSPLNVAVASKTNWKKKNNNNNKSYLYRLIYVMTLPNAFRR